MKHPVRAATVGLAAAAALSTAVLVSQPAGAQPVANSGPATTKVATAKVKSGVSAQATNGYTFDWGNKNGWWILNLNGLPVYAGQPAALSITEVDGAGNEFIGGAKMHCENVSVAQNRVSTRCFVDWGSPLHIRVHYVY